jgi:hypothetical protein
VQLYVKKYFFSPPDVLEIKFEPQRHKETQRKLRDRVYGVQKRHLQIIKQIDPNFDKTKSISIFLK